MKTIFLITIATASSLMAIPLPAFSQSVAQTDVVYTSPLADFQPFSVNSADNKVLPWKATNDEVGHIGGWRAYAKEAQSVTLASPQPPASLRLISFETLTKAPLPVRQAWFKAVAAQEMAVYAKRVYASSQASAELAKRMHGAGNFTRLQQVNVQAVHAESAVLLLNSTQAASQERESLIRALGLNDALASRLALPERLPDLPAAPLPETVLKQVVRVTDSNKYASEAPSELRSSYAAYRSAYDLSRHYRDEMLPLRKAIAEETTLLYNGMFIGVFELLAENREQSRAVMAAIAAQLAFWQAEAAFQDTLLIQRRPNLDASGD